jgi:hypothetical protein
MKRIVTFNDGKRPVIPALPLALIVHGASRPTWCVFISSFRELNGRTDTALPGHAPIIPSGCGTSRKDGAIAL